ncbi:RidA family protein [Lichenifustis flavocetrariae]|uniref:RidA family protein n=1 Tax=Lichenifustis flavocetrariae TaxID=2949735 RepID=A0AA42CJ78_9HYPH|nr:RidA family protein [Lichenifustis flavocetrariae]MCW6509303.1 RidA family protein [Lichenifustis flavocetrariae]
MSLTPDAIAMRLHDLGKALPDTAHPRALFRPWRRSGALLILSGQVNERDGTIIRPGTVGSDMSVEEARGHAETCLLNLLFHVRAACDGQLDRVACLLRLGGFVAAVPGFADAPLVINAASELLIGLYGQDCGAHARTAIAVTGLPGGAPVEIDAMLEILP